MEKTLNELVERLQAAAGENLRSVVLYGSAVTGDFKEGHSDLNVLCLVRRSRLDELEQLRDAAASWVKQGHPAPLVFTLEELRSVADVFAIELLDMKSRHRVLQGEDFLRDFEVPMALHHLQVERELRYHWVRLRESVLTSPAKPRALGALMTRSVSAFVTLFRHALMAFGETPPEGRRAAVDRIAELAGADPSAFHRVLDMRSGKLKTRNADVPGMLRGYLEMVERVTAEVDRRLAVS